MFGPLRGFTSGQKLNANRIWLRRSRNNAFLRRRNETNSYRSIQSQRIMLQPSIPDRDYRWL